MVVNYFCNLHCGNNKHYGQIDADRSIEMVAKVVCDVADYVSQNCGQQRCEDESVEGAAEHSFNLDNFARVVLTDFLAEKR